MSAFLSDTAPPSGQECLRSGPLANERARAPSPRQAGVPALLRVSFVWLACFAVAASAWAATELRVGNVLAVPGGTVFVPIRCTSDTNLVAAQFDLILGSPDLTAGDAIRGPALADHEVTCGEPDPSLRRVIVHSPANALLRNGAWAYIPLTLASNTPYGSIPLLLSNVLLATYDAIAITNVSFAGASLVSTSSAWVPPNIERDPFSKLVYPGALVTLTVSASGSAPLAFQWWFNGSNALAGATNSTLTFSNAWAGHAGNYSVTVSNALGVETSGLAYLTVAQPLQVSVQGRGTVAKTPDLAVYDIGQSVTLTATPARWYAFNRWADGLTANPRTIAIGPTNTYKAVFAPATSLEQWTNQISGETWEVPVGTPKVFIYGQPTFGGSFSLPGTNGAQFVMEMTTSFPNGSIFYTLDGSQPDPGSAYYDGTPLTNTTDVVFRAVAFNEAFDNSAEADPVRLTFTPVYSLTGTTPGGGAVALSPAALTTNSLYLSNSVVTLTATPSNGWTFLNWIGSVISAQNPLTLTLTQAVSVQAIFGTSLTNSVTLAGYGSVLREPGLTLYRFGTPVRLSAVPAAGKYFNRWTGAGTGFSNSPITYTVTVPNTNFSGLFASLTGSNRALTVLVTGQGDVTKTPHLAFYTNTQSVTLTPQAATDWIFAGWSGDASGAANPLGVVMSANKTITANFIYPPVITNQPVGGNIAAGSNFTLTVAARGLDPLSYQWRFNGPDLSGATNPSLTLSHVQPSQAGSYSAVVTNAYGSVTSDVAVLTVTGSANLAPAITSQPQSQIGGLGGSASFTVGVSGTPPLAYQWLKSVISNQWTVISGATNSAFSFQPLALSDAGNYFAVVTNAFGSATSVVATLTVTQAVSQLPQIAFVSPTNGASFTAPVNVALIASASDAVGLARVDFFSQRQSNNAPPVLLASVSQPALTNAELYLATWTNAPVGSNNLFAVAVNTLGLSAMSAPVTVVVQTALPQVALTSPTNGATFFAPASILLNALASDADNSISNVTFYVGTNLLATFTPQQPFNFNWSNVAVGNYSLSARVQDIYGPVVTSAPVNVSVVAPGVPASFRLAGASYTVAENAGTVAVTVTNLGTLGGTVNYACVDVTATGGSGSSGDYTRLQGSLTFANGELSKTLLITVRDDLLPEANETFEFQLSNPGGGASLASPSVATITILDDDAYYATNSWLALAFPAGVPDTSGRLRVTLTPPEAGGQWRFPWELGWRNNGTLVTNLEVANYEIEFRSVAGYAAIPASVTVAVAGGGAITESTNQYFFTGPGGAGWLTVQIEPNTVVSSAGWRLVGEGPYRASGAAATDLVPGVHVIEFKPLSGWSAPAKRAVMVYADQGSVVTGSYLLADPLPGGVQLPVAINPFSVINESLTYSPLLPYAYNGQLHTANGFGSGVAVRDRVVLTAAHVVFDDATLSFANEVNWFFQKHAGDFDPKPQKARGWYVLSSYSAARSNDLASGYYAPGQSSPQSRNWDVAALYFTTTTAARGGSGGYLTSDAATNEWLVSSRQKMLTGYPLDGAAFGYVGLLPGKLHATAALNYKFTAQSNRVYTTPGFLSFPGNSGGPVYVLNSNAYYPAGVYLGTLGNNLSLVRSVDSNVVSLINLAANLGDEGTNNTGGGVLTIISSSTGGTGLGYLQVHVGPAAALAAGGGWRLAGGTNLFSSDPNHTDFVTVQTTYAVEFATADGWGSPPNRSVTVPLGQLTVIEARYVLLPPVLTFTRGTGIGITGATGTTYRIEYRTKLTSGAWLPLRTNTLGAGFNLLLPWPPTNGPAAFYRVVWLP